MVQIICDTWKEAKGFIMQYPELIGQVMLKSEGKNIVDIYDPNHTKDWTTLISQEKLIQIVNSIENILEPSIKTGSNDVYKELLSDQRWIDKSNEIKRKDFYTCTKCYNSIVLRDVSELRTYLKDEKDFKTIISALSLSKAHTRNSFPFPRNKELITHGNGWKVPIISHDYITSINLYVYEICKQAQRTPHGIELPQVNGIYFSNVKLDTSESCEWFWGAYNMIDSDNNNFYIKDAQGKYQSIFCQYIDNGNTNDKYILSYKFNSNKTYYYPSFYGHMGILSYNKISIIFPLSKRLFPIVLEVHHKVYKKENGEFIKPWEYKDDELETLCHSCHEQTHLEENIKIIHNNHF